ncbi:MAG: hypothetical protein GW808_00190 [Sphingomonadales bacterium]|nr:hypothetical protein [Sphingomonadales bacterium]NCO48330.1 hypothetical protein [Sphingomonadales bacterium]NCP41874.1 hypothetical protein [Sphingomonadales bacterium]NCQ07598.1 hypothetical protein [Sphingomonadales bacterium]NCQ49560.1 hypothetical protein [Sphingomonadales bacterium]
MTSDGRHRAEKNTRLTRSCGIDQMKHFNRYKTDAAPSPFAGIQEKLDGYCDPAVGLLLFSIVQASVSSHAVPASDFVG